MIKDYDLTAATCCQNCPFGEKVEKEKGDRLQEIHCKETARICPPWVICNLHPLRPPAYDVLDLLEKNTRQLYKRAKRDNMNTLPYKDFLKRIQMCRTDEGLDQLREWARQR